MKTILTKIKQDQRGQALLFVVVAMTLALTVGVSLSSRTLTGFRRTVSTDTSARVLSAAEGGVEWFLVQPISVLESLSDANNTNNGNDCPNGTTWESSHANACIVSYDPPTNPQPTDLIATKAFVTVEKFTDNFSDGVNDHYWFQLEPGNVKQIFTRDYTNNTYFAGTLEVCWQSLDVNQPAALYYTTYNASGIRAKQLVEPSATANNGGIMDLEGAIEADSGRVGTDYTSCVDINIASGANIEGIRLKTLYANAKVGVFGDNVPVQGYKITALGEIDNVAERVKTVKEVTVYKSLPYMPALFDYAIYSNEALD